MAQTFITLIYIAYMLGVPLMYLILTFLDRSPNGSVQIQIDTGPLSREGLFLALALVWPILILGIVGVWISDEGD